MRTIGLTNERNVVGGQAQIRRTTLALCLPVSRMICV